MGADAWRVAYYAQGMLVRSACRRSSGVGMTGIFRRRSAQGCVYGDLAAAEGEARQAEYKLERTVFLYLERPRGLEESRSCSSFSSTR
jgi:hypothetical protein